MNNLRKAVDNLLDTARFPYGEEFPGLFEGGDKKRARQTATGPLRSKSLQRKEDSFSPPLSVQELHSESDNERQDDERLDKNHSDHHRSKELTANRWVASERLKH